MSREPFFPLTVLDTSPATTPSAPDCGNCGLYRSAVNPKIPVSGKGRKKILVVTDKVGPHEEELNIHNAGGHARHLSTELNKHGIDLRDDCWSYSAVVCNGQNKQDTVSRCRPNVVNLIKKLKPEKILLLGTDAIRAVIGHLWHDGTGAEDQWVGYQIPSVEFNAWVCPTFHPRRLYEDKNGPANLYFQRHVERFAKLAERPHGGRNTLYESRVRVVVDPEKAAGLLRDCFGSCSSLAFDYETTTLKPDGPHARIVSCAVSDGHTAVAYPWVGPAVAATKEILVNPKIRKIGANLSFEARWTRKFLKCEVRNWLWDTVLGAHALDNNTTIRQVSSVKFQAFVTLGVPLWDRKVEKYLKSPGNEKLGNAPNRIHEVDLNTLLTYNGLDALYEFLIAKHQHQRMNDALKHAEVD